MIKTMINLKNKFTIVGSLLALALMISCDDDDNGPGNIAPEASFQRSTAIAVLGAPISFTDVSSDEDGEIVDWFWDFGDGTGTSMEQNPTYSYSTEGTFTVTLTVTDDAGESAEATETVRIEGNFVTNWEFTASTDVLGTSGPVLSEDGMIFIGSQDFNIYGINSDGTQAWSFTTENKVRSTGAYSNGTVYFGGIDGKLYSLNASSGALNWEYEMGDEVFIGGPSIASDGTIFVGTRDANTAEVFYAINSNGSLKWSTAVGEVGAGVRVRTAGTISDDGSTVYFGTTTGVLYALNTSDGSISWQFAAGNNIESTPALGSDGTIYFGSDDGFLYALNSDGTEKWKVNLDKGEGARAAVSPAIGPDGTIYIGTKETQSLHAVSSSGTELWFFTTGNIIISAPFVGDDGVIYFGSFDGKLYALNSDGTERFSITSGPDLQGTDDDGNPIDGRVWSAPVVQNGVLYYGAYDGVLRALTVSSRGPADSDWPMRGYNAQRINRR